MQSPPLEFSDEEILEELLRRGYRSITPRLLKDVKSELDKALANVKDDSGRTRINLQNEDQPSASSKAFSSIIEKTRADGQNVDYNQPSTSGIQSSSASTSSSTVKEVLLEELTFTDEEILEALHTMGYDDITLEMLAAVKDELPKAIEDDLTSTESTSSRLTATNTQGDDISSPATEYSGHVSDDERSGTESYTTISTPVDKPVSQRLVKRKALRHTKNGTPFITEDFYLWHMSNVASESSDYRSSSSVPDNQKQAPPRTADSKQAKKNFISLANLAERSELQRRKFCKSDPVTLYHKYKKSWEAHNIPGERSHKELRWNLREKMLDYDSTIKISFPPGRTYNLVL